jgi:hypothetical protein
VYAPRLERDTITLQEGQLDSRVERRQETMADRVTELVEQIRFHSNSSSPSSRSGYGS